MSNIVREMNGRLGRDWVGEGVIEISSSHGPGIWYVLPVLPYVVPFLRVTPLGEEGTCG